MAGVSDAEGLICLLSDEVSAKGIENAPELKVISNYAVGFNNIDMAAATKRGIPVCNTPGVLTDATADLAWALLMSVACRVVEGDSEKGWLFWLPKTCWQFSEGRNLHTA